MDFVQKQRRRALAVLLALPTLAGTSAAQVIYNGEAVLPDQPLVSSTYQGTTIYQVGQSGTGYDKSGTSVARTSVVYDKSGTSHTTGGATFYTKGTSPAVTTTGSTTVTANDTTLSSNDPAAIYLNNVGQRIADHQDNPQVPTIVFEDSDDDGDDAVASVSPGFNFLGGDDIDDDSGTVTIRATDPITALSGGNALRLSLGYGMANTGDFFYGTDSPYISTSAASADWPSAGDTYLNSAAVSQELGHRGLRAMLRADVRSFFVDGAFGSYQIEDQTSQRTYNLAEAAEDQATATVRVGPQFWAIDGDGTAEFGSFTASGDAVSGTEYDSLLVKTTINSTLTDVGGAAGYNLQLSNLPVQVGLGVGVRSIQRTTVASIDGDYTIVTTGEVSDTDFPDHTYTEELTGIYAGPVVRVNYDTALGAKLGAHFGGSLQALYGRSALSARQAFSTETNTFETTDTGFMVGVEAEAGLSYQITPALTLGVGVYGTLTQGAPEVAAAVDPAATEAATQQPSLKGGSWSEMGLKGSISTTF